ncbi:MAG: hypothetical protein B0D86_04585 [Candidatus Sedimenticola endophacoides]|nr:MAG: hypothetical protein B0D86_04585 [Candidatus Sedimenticola endophacoides]
MLSAEQEHDLAIRIRSGRARP